MCALTLLLSACSSRFLLQSSSLQSGWTSDVKAIHLPSGDQTGAAAPVEIFVICSLSPPSSLSMVQICRSEEHTSELQSQSNLVCRLLLEKKKNIQFK